MCVHVAIAPLMLMQSVQLMKQVWLYMYAEADSICLEVWFSNLGACLCSFSNPTTVGSRGSGSSAQTHKVGMRHIHATTGAMQVTQDEC